MKMYAVKFTRDELDNLADVCRDYANYIINESGCPEEYDFEISVLLSTLSKIGYKYTAIDLEKDYNEKN